MELHFGSRLLAAWLSKGTAREELGENIGAKVRAACNRCYREVRTFNNNVIKWKSYFRIKLIFEGAIAEERVEPMEKSQRIRITFQPSQVHGQGEGTRAR